MILGAAVSLIQWGVDRYFNSQEKKANTQIELADINARRQESKDKVRASVLSLGGWKFQIFFIAPLGLWFSSVVIYSILFHSNGPYPQPWDIAALPPPLNDWAGIIIAYLFLVSGEKR